MSTFFIRRPIVAMVIAIVMVIVGLVSITLLPVAQFPSIVPPEIQISATYPGADAQTLEQSVAAPLEEQITGVDNMNYMYFGERQQWANPDHGGFRRQNGSQHRSGAVAVAHLAGAIPTAGAGQHRRIDHPKIAHLAVIAGSRFIRRTGHMTMSFSPITPTSIWSMN